MEEAALTKALERTKSGRTAIETSDYKEAAASFTAATTHCQTALIGLYCTHASVLISADKYSTAKVVAETAIRVAPKHSLAWYWKGMALFKIGHEDKAKAAFNKAAEYEKDLTKKTSYMDWAARCDDVDIETIDATMGEDQVMAGTEGTSARTVPVSMHKKTQRPATPAPAPAPAPVAPAVPVAPKDKTRMEWYESKTHVNVEIYAKNMNKEESDIAIEDSRVSFQLKRPEMEDYVFEVDLHSTIVPDESTWNINRFKFEARLKKANSAEKWRSFDKDGNMASRIIQAGAEARRINDAQDAHNRELKKFTETELKDYKEDDSTAALFRTLYKDADEDMRRAMMKSYTESNGKVLSTNWEDVKKKKVEYEEKE